MNKDIENKTTLLQIANYWLLFNKNRFKESTFHCYKYKIEKYISGSKLSLLFVSQINDTNIADFVNTLIQNQLSSKTVNDVISLLNAILKFAKNKYHINIPCVPYVKNDYKEMRVFTLSEQRTLEKNIKNNMDNYKFGIYIALYTGIRIGELCALKWEDINNGIITINKTVLRIKDGNKTRIITDSPKTNNSYRNIPVPDFLNDIIEKNRKTSDSFVLSTEKTPFVEPRLMQIHFKKVMYECNIQNASFHTLRHTFATRCVECGFDIKSLSEILGHSNIQITLNKYVHSSMELKMKNMNKLQIIAR